jgi:outer membrane protein
MKTLIRALFLVVMLSFTFATTAQTLKIGHIDSNEIMNQMPERGKVEEDLMRFEQQLEAELRMMATEYQNKVAEYQNNLATMSNLIRQAREKEISDLQLRIQDFQQNADQEFNEKRIELLTPLIDKIKKAIEEVGKESGYTYIIDAATGVLLHVGAGANDLTPKVKEKLGIR